MNDIKMVGFRAFWWYYFAHVYIWGPITKSKWLVGLGGKICFIPKGFIPIPTYAGGYYVFILYRLRVVASCVSKVTNFTLPHLHLAPL